MYGWFVIVGYLLIKILGCVLEKDVDSKFGDSARKVCSLEGILLVTYILLYLSQYNSFPISVKNWF